MENLCYNVPVRIQSERKINNSEVGFYASSVRRLGSRRETKRRALTRSYDILSAPVATDEYISCVEESGFISSLDIIYFVTVSHTHTGGVFFMQLFIYNNAASGNMKCSLLIRAINAIIKPRLFLSMIVASGYG